MLADKALELIKELHRSKDGQLPPFNEDAIRQIFQEMDTLYKQNQRDVNATVAGDKKYFSGVHLRHAALERNKRCVLTYLYNRLNRIKEMRWDLGSILPAETRSSLCEPEIQWFNRYNKNLATYMRSIGEGKGLDLTQDITPPKNLYIELINDTIKKAGLTLASFAVYADAATKEDLHEMIVCFNDGYKKAVMKAYVVEDKSVQESRTLLGLCKALLPVIKSVRCMEDYGELDLDEGDSVVLQKNTTHYLPMSHCQHLIRQGILKHVE